MEYELPSKENYTIYSKSGCPACNKAKQLLQNEQIEVIDCDDYIIDNKPAFLEFMRNLIGTEYKTFPMVFNQTGKFIGGFSELKPYYEEELKAKDSFPDPFIGNVALKSLFSSRAEVADRSSMVSSYPAT